MPPFPDPVVRRLGLCFAFDLRDDAQALLPDVGAQTVLAR